MSIVQSKVTLNLYFRCPSFCVRLCNETAVLCVHIYLVRCIDDGQVRPIVLLDLSASCHVQETTQNALFNTAFSTC